MKLSGSFGHHLGDDVDHTRLSSESNLGFSVLEMLVALAFTGTIVSVLMTLSNSWLHIQDRGKAEIALIESVSLGLDSIRRDIDSSGSRNKIPEVNSHKFVGSPYELKMPGYKSGRDVIFEYINEHNGGLSRHELQLINNSLSNSIRPSRVFPAAVKHQFSFIDFSGAAHPQWDSAEFPAKILISLSWPTAVGSPPHTVEIRFPQYLAPVCVQASSMDHCMKRLENGTETSQPAHRASHALRSRRNR